MKEQLRMAVCYWHNFCRNGFNPFSHTGTLDRPSFKMTDPMDSAKAKADAAFEFFSNLGLPYYACHDRDIAPEGATPQESVRNLKTMVEYLGRKQANTGVKQRYAGCEAPWAKDVLAGTRKLDDVADTSSSAT